MAELLAAQSAAALRRLESKLDALTLSFHRALAVHGLTYVGVRARLTEWLARYEEEVTLVRELRKEKQDEGLDVTVRGGVGDRGLEKRVLGVLEAMERRICPPCVGRVVQEVERGLRGGAGEGFGEGEGGGGKSGGVE